MTKRLNSELTPEDQHLWNDLNSRLIEGSDMHETERRFLFGLLKNRRPKKILELGVQAGGGSALILSAIKSSPQAHLYSVDILYNLLTSFSPNYKTNNEVGYVVRKNFPELAGNKWTLYQGRRCEELLHEIGPGLDFVILDTSHALPGELLDFLLILPYTTEDCVFVVHDINLEPFFNLGRNIGEAADWIWCCRLLMNVIKGEKSYPTELPPSPFSDDISLFLMRDLKNRALPNIGAFTVDPEMRKNPEDIFNCLLMRWTKQFNYASHMKIIELMRGHYPEHLVDIYEMAYHYNRRMAEKISAAAEEQRST